MSACSADLVQSYTSPAWCHLQGWCRKAWVEPMVAHHHAGEAEAGEPGGGRATRLQQHRFHKPGHLHHPWCSLARRPEGPCCVCLGVHVIDGMHAVAGAAGALWPVEQVLLEPLHSPASQHLRARPSEQARHRKSRCRKGGKKVQNTSNFATTLTSFSPKILPPRPIPKRCSNRSSFT